jgi:hypothetical protein
MVRINQQFLQHTKINVDNFLYNLNLELSRSLDINRIALNTKDSQRTFDKTLQNEQYPNVTRVNTSDKQIEIGNTNIKSPNQVESNDQKQIDRYSSAVGTRVKKRKEY